MRRAGNDWEWISGITEQQRQLAIRRTDFLVDSIGANMSLKDLLANAYLQGLIDASEVMAMQEARAA